MGNQNTQQNHSKYSTRRWLYRSAFGFTLIEMVVGIAIMAILVTGIIGVFTLLSRSIKVGREKSVISSLAASYLEIARNLPYSQVGTISGNPNGSLPDFTTPTTVSVFGTNYKIYYEVTYIDDPADGTAALGTDAYPNDYKQVKMTVVNATTNAAYTFVTNIAPKGLETDINAGSFLIKVINASGQPVAGASVHITKTDNSINLNRVTDANGVWNELGLPAGVNAYHIVVTKAGYSTDQTYPISGQNPNPVKPDATIRNGTDTSITFAIDQLANLSIKTLDSTCSNLSGVQLNIAGAKLIGTNPSVLKYNNSFSSINGLIALNNIEWDVYTPSLVAAQPYTVMGTSPIQSISVLPNSSQTYTILLAPPSANSLLVIVKDSSSGAAIEGATAHLYKNGLADLTGVSGGSIWLQTDWSGGSGQPSWNSAKTSYFSDDGNLDATNSNKGVQLEKTGGNYALTGQLTSGTFNTNAATTQYTTISWAPTSQNPSTTVQFQVAANNDNATWNYIGPDGTAATYYTVPGSTINVAANSNQYIRYRLFESTTDNKSTPQITNVSINYVSGCQTPGQTYFGNLSANPNYNLDVSLATYQTTSLTNLNISGNQVLQIQLSH